MTGRRWPVHPSPVEGESLSSWLTRIAERHGLSLSELLRHDLLRRDVEDLDMDPGPALLAAVASRSGVPHERLRLMSMAGWQPWLFDALLPKPEAYQDYVRRYAILLPLARRRFLEIHNWCAWRTKEPLRRACPECLQARGSPVMLLVWQLPLMLSCPWHGCRLKTYPGTPCHPLLGEPDATVIEPAPPEVLAMDRRTWQGLTTGQVDLPLRTVHAGVWFRLLRAVLDEVNTPKSYWPRNGANFLDIWGRTRFVERAGQYVARPIERMSPEVQVQILETAAIALHLVETTPYRDGGAEAALFRPEPILAEDQDPGKPERTVADEMNDAFLELVSQAREQPEVAVQVLRMMIFGDNNIEQRLAQARDWLIYWKVPPEFLPETITLS